MRRIQWGEPGYERHGRNPRQVAGGLALKPVQAVLKPLEVLLSPCLAAAGSRSMAMRSRVARGAQSEEAVGGLLAGLFMTSSSVPECFN